MITERQKELTIYLNTAAKAYYSGEDEILTNHAYDILEQELISLEDESGVVLPGSVTHKVGYEVVSGLKKVKHEVPALSLRKSKDPSDVWKFGKGMSLVGSWKEDGLTVFLTYDNGILTRALTRSDGYIGEDVTHIAKHFADIPLSIPYKKHLLIRGEAVIRYDDFNELNARSSRDYRNPRNLASGQVRLLDSTKLDVPIYFRPFRVIGENIATKYMAQMIWLKELGFDPVETETIDSFESLKEYIDKYEKKAENYPFPVDGLVFT